MEALAAVMVVGIFCEPADGLQNAEWLAVMLATKAVGIGAGYALYKLTVHWHRQGAITEFTEMITEE